MRERALSCLLIAFLAIPQALSAQGFSIGGRAGTLGFGGEVALGFSDTFVVRGGLGSFIFDLEGEYDGVEYTVTLPSKTATVGIDLYPGGGSFRLMAGVMFRDGDFEMESGDLSQAGSIEIGDNNYEEGGTLHGALKSKSSAPFLGLGFGHHVKGSFGMFIDFGVAFMGEADVTLEAQGAIADVPGLQEDLDREIQNIKDEVGSYLEFWPIISLGVKIPFG